MKITLRGYYAILALVSMAQNHEADARTRVEDIAVQHPIPEPFLLQIFQILRRSGLVRSKRGVKGGFQLAKPASQIFLTEIIESIEGEILPSPIEEKMGSRNLPTSWVALDHLCGELRGKIREVVNGYTLADLAARLHPNPNDMYYI